MHCASSVSPHALQESWLQGRLSWESQWMCWCSSPLVLAEDFSQGGPGGHLSETWAVISFELPHESYKAEKPQILFFSFLFIFFLLCNQIELFFPSFLEVVFHFGLVVGNPSRYRARAALHLLWWKDARKCS